MDYHYYLFVAAIEALMKDKKFYEVDMRHLRVEMEKVALLVNENKGKKNINTSHGLCYNNICHLIMPPILSISRENKIDNNIEKHVPQCSIGLAHYW